MQYIGQKKALDNIQSALATPRESRMLNIVGTYGSGRSALLAYIEQEIRLKNWEMPQLADPIIIIVQGMNYSTDDRFLNFLTSHLTKHIEAQIGGELSPNSLAQSLSEIAAQDIPVIIMIDNFARIMDRLQDSEAHELNKLRPVGVHYWPLIIESFARCLNPFFIFQSFLRTQNLCA
jgi:hypothetical protein